VIPSLIIILNIFSGSPGHVSPLSLFHIHCTQFIPNWNQLNSDSSDIPIIEALQRGVRVIELDMWSNSSKNNIDILHGG
jgi:hypothetical protein